MNSINDDRVMKDIVRDSYLDLTDPEFNSATMKRIVCDTRRRRVLNGIFVNLLVFVAIDSLILLLLSLTGSSVADLAGEAVKFLDSILFRTGQLKAPVAASQLAAYVMLSVAGILAIFAILELRMGSWKGRGDGTLSG